MSVDQAVAVKAPSKKSQADAIFAAHLQHRKDGKYTSNKAFRAAVLHQVMEELGVSTSSASTMYNMAKKDAEAADASLGLGRDPRKVVVKVSSGQRGRPRGSKSKPKVEVPDSAAAATLDLASAEVAGTEAVGDQSAEAAA